MTDPLRVLAHLIVILYAGRFRRSYSSSVAFLRIARPLFYLLLEQRKMWTH